MGVEMKSQPSILVLLIVLATAPIASAALQQYTFQRYQAILERQPFGEVKRDTRPTPPPGPVAPPFTKDITMCAITEDDSGIQVGFVNVAVRPPKNYLLYVGETEDEFTLVRADYTRETALLKKGDKEQWISMAGPVDAGGMATPQAASTPVRRTARTARTVRPKATPPKKKRLSYAERLRMRREAVAQRAGTDNTVLTGDALKKHLEEYQMNLIRNGQPALPMPLTPEMDAKLVAEGVLPPVEGVEEPAQ